MKSSKMTESKDHAGIQNPCANFDNGSHYYGYPSGMAGATADPCAHLHPMAWIGLCRAWLRFGCSCAD